MAALQLDFFSRVSNTWRWQYWYILYLVCCARVLCREEDAAGGRLRAETKESDQRDGVAFVRVHAKDIDVPVRQRGTAAPSLTHRRSHARIDALSHARMHSRTHRCSAVRSCTCLP
eukprot:6206463-Pleurochrysis_carterae.AAC.1